MKSILAPHLTVADLASRAELAFATVELCEAYRGVLCDLYELGGSGEVANINDRALLVEERCATELSAFVAAWHRGSTAIENMGVIGVAVWGYVKQFDLDDTIRAGAERLSIDFMRKVVRRLPSPEYRGRAVATVFEAQDRLEVHLDAVLGALRANRGLSNDEATEAGQAVLEAAGGVLRRGYDPLRMQVELDWWSRATGGPSIRIERSLAA